MHIFIHENNTLCLCTWRTVILTIFTLNFCASAESRRGCPGVHQGRAWQAGPVPPPQRGSRGGWGQPGAAPAPGIRQGLEAGRQPVGQAGVPGPPMGLVWQWQLLRHQPKVGPEALSWPPHGPLSPPLPISSGRTGLCSAACGIHWHGNLPGAHTGVRHSQKGDGGELKSRSHLAPAPQGLVRGEGLPWPDNIQTQPLGGEAASDGDG